MNARSITEATLVERALRCALAFDDASLVIFRRGVLVEFKTALLTPRLSSTTEGTHRGWQVGPSDGHHCHLDLASVTSIWFDAEPVSCQGGRLNFTVWFLAAADCGNPYRADGAFSITLNSPYGSDGIPRRNVILPFYSLYDANRHIPGITASAAFERARPQDPVLVRRD
jgi:hypothetical protein